MLKFHVDLHTINPENNTQDIKFHTIVDAENAESAQQLAMTVLEKEHPGLNPCASWEWSVYEFPMG